MLDPSSGDCRIECTDASTGEIITCTFRPCFKNLMRLGTPAEIVDIFGKLFCVGLHEWLEKTPVGLLPQLEHSYMRDILPAAVSVLYACHDEQDCEQFVQLVGGYAPSWAKDRLVYQMGKMPIADVITIARSLLKHGMIGEAPKREGGEYSAEFNPAEFVDLVCTLLKVSQSEAEEMTMTRFQRRFEQMYPEKKKEKAERISREEYEQLKAELNKGDSNGD